MHDSSPKTGTSPGVAPAPATRVALVTGGAKRVGKAVAIQLAKAGMDIAITCLTSKDDARQTQATIQSLGRRCEIIEVDLAFPDSASRVHDAVNAHYSRLDVLVNNASVFDATPLSTMTGEQFDRQMAINARTPLLLMQQFAPMLRAHHDTKNPATMGRIVNFIDIHVMGQHLKGFMAYNVSKAALMEATMTAALDLAPAITVNAIAPGVVAWAESYTPQAREAYMRRVPLDRAGTPDDAAAAVKFLACDAHYCTGQIIKLDGGRFIT